MSVLSGRHGGARRTYGEGAEAEDVPLNQTVLVLDATELQRDWLLRGQEFRVLRGIAQSEHLRVAVPESVLVETVGNRRRRAEELVAAWKRLRREARRIGAALEADVSGDDDYEERLRAALEILGIETVEYPQVSHAEIVKRAVNRWAPFDATGSGYRDALTPDSCHPGRPGVTVGR